MMITMEPGTGRWAGWWRVTIPRARRESTVWLSGDQAAELHALLGKNLSPVVTGRVERAGARLRALRLVWDLRGVSAAVKVVNQRVVGP